MGKNLRLKIQVIFAFITNSYLIGFVRGKIYQGSLKNVCVPGMNCYSCPGAVMSCPIGSIQAVIGSPNYKFSFYIAGFLIVVGSIMGRFVCGFLCPFGLVQDLLNKIPFKTKISTYKYDKLLRKLKYIILVVFVIIMPMFFVELGGAGAPYFCKIICPVGTLEAGIPLVVMNSGLRSIISFLYVWKLAILILIIILSIIIYRPFCKYICPLGAIYSLFNKVSIIKFVIEEDKCIKCRQCNNVCKMNVDVMNSPNDLECIRCMDCINACPTKAIHINNLKNK